MVYTPYHQHVKEPLEISSTGGKAGMLKAMGIKDPEMMEKKRKASLKRKQQREWKEKVETVERMKAEKQKKRADNIKATIQEKKMRKIEKIEKKLMYPEYKTTGGERTLGISVRKHEDRRRTLPRFGYGDRADGLFAYHQHVTEQLEISGGGPGGKAGMLNAMGMMEKKRKRKASLKKKKKSATSLPPTAYESELNPIGDSKKIEIYLFFSSNTLKCLIRRVRFLTFVKASKGRRKSKKPVVLRKYAERLKEEARMKAL